MADNDNGVGSFGWFLAGLGLGALVGVLYAPKSGKETREELVAGAMDARERANELYSQGVTQGKQYVEQGKQVASEYVDKGKQVASEYADKGKEYYDKGRTQWTQYVDKGKQVVQNQQQAVAAAVDAGKEAYVEKTNEVLPS
ncbi:MAG: YtxH domain-containing protein [Acidobacteriaceae bacterium]|nr:YtxH domain-containing protein [Acidobacteriaceae bacterium]